MPRSTSSNTRCAGENAEIRFWQEDEASNGPLLLSNSPFVLPSVVTTFKNSLSTITNAF